MLSTFIRCGVVLWICRLDKGCLHWKDNRWAELEFQVSLLLSLSQKCHWETHTYNSSSTIYRVNSVRSLALRGNQSENENPEFETVEKRTGKHLKLSFTRRHCHSQIIKNSSLWGNMIASVLKVHVILNYDSFLDGVNCLGFEIQNFDCLSAQTSFVYIIETMTFTNFPVIFYHL